MKTNKNRLILSSLFKRKTSNIINQKRLNQLTAKNKALVKLLNKTQVSMIKKCKSDSKYYHDLLKKLIIEGCIKMMEPTIIVYCLQRDKTLINELLPICKKEYEDILLKELKEKIEITIKCTDNNYLLQRDIPDLSNIDIANIEPSHEQSIKINHMDDDKYWLVH